MLLMPEDLYHRSSTESRITKPTPDTVILICTESESHSFAHVCALLSTAVRGDELPHLIM